MATHSSVLAWRIPWTEEPGELWSIGHYWNNLACTHTYTCVYIPFSNILRINSYPFTWNIDATWVPVPCAFYVLVAFCIEFTYIENPIRVIIFDFIIQTWFKELERERIVIADHIAVSVSFSSRTRFILFFHLAMLLGLRNLSSLAVIALSPSTRPPGKSHKNTF